VPPTGTDWLARIRVALAGTRAGDPADARLGGLEPELTAKYRAYLPANPRPAAVLVPLVHHADGLTVLLTERAADLRNHPGQISFPGGRMEAGESPLEAALRETEEEIGLDRRHVEPLGYLPCHLIVSGYCVTPIVAAVAPGVPLRLDPVEVAGTFEVPFVHLMDPANHRGRIRKFGDDEVEVFDIPYGTRNIWGATAGMLLTLCRLLDGKGAR
jgi:8-oxo-dGTP pyrophosphatase MutT (NUDIX family)